MNQPPPPTTESIPTMRVSVALTYVRDCAECRGIAERAAIAAIHDASVSTLSITPGKHHAHVIAANAAPALAPEPVDAAQMLFAGVPISDTNGFDPPPR